MGKRKTVWPTDREVRLRFILFALLDTASVQGAPPELLLSVYKLLRDSPTEAQLLNAIHEILNTDEMYGFSFPACSEAEELMQTLKKTVV